MAPLHIETFNPGRKEWVRVGEIHPTDLPGSISNNKPDGKRDIYQLKCEKDDSKSVIFKCIAGVDTEVGTFRAIIPISKMEVVKELTRGESFEMDIRTDRSTVSRKIRFTHK